MCSAGGGFACELFSKIITVLMRPNLKPLNVTLKEYLKAAIEMDGSRANMFVKLYLVESNWNSLNTAQ